MRRRCGSSFLITSFGPEFPSLVFLPLLADFHIRAVIAVSLHPAVDVKIEGGQKAIGFSLMKDLYPLELVLMVEEKDMSSDQGDRSFVELAVQGDGAVFGNPSSYMFAEITLKVGRRGPEALHLSGETPKGALVGGAVLSLMVNVV